MKFTRTGAGPPLVLVHGLGNSAQGWNPVVPGLAAERELILVTLPGHDGDPVSPELGTFAGLMGQLRSLYRCRRPIRCAVGRKLTRRADGA
jgi:pimeloyl-ACP methyl ester carboxylesterase